MPVTRSTASSGQSSRQAHIAGLLEEDSGKSIDEGGITMSVIVMLFAII